MAAQFRNAEDPESATAADRYLGKLPRVFHWRLMVPATSRNSWQFEDAYFFA